MIHKRMQYEERRGLAASDVQLYWARKENGEWLAREDALKGILQDKMDMTLYPPMLPLRMLDGFEYFGVQSLPVDKLHVLVVLPLEEIDDDVSLQDEPRKRKYDHSQVDACAGQEILSSLNFHVEELSSTPISGPNNVCAADGFEWNSIYVDCKEDESAPNKAQQRDLYQAYLARHLDDVLKTEKLCVVGVPEDLKVLTVGVRDIQFTGQPDLLILSEHARNDPSSLQLLPDVQMLVEVKQRVDPDDDFMAMTELIALDIVARTPVVALLTDLNSNWRFFWVAEATDDHAVVHKTTITTPGEAFDVLREFLSHSVREVENGRDCVAMDRPVKRRKLSHLQRPGGGGLRELVKRFSDVRDELGPDGAAELAFEIANHLVQSIPAYHFHSW
jgi:hypothetical protein